MTHSWRPRPLPPPPARTGAPSGTNTCSPETKSDEHLCENCGGIIDNLKADGALRKTYPGCRLQALINSTSVGFQETETVQPMNTVISH